jgi:hypothetical protein
MMEHLRVFWCPNLKWTYQHNFEVRHLRCVCVNIKHDVGDSQNTTNYLFATAGVQDSNNYMFQSFLLAIIRLYIPSFKSMYNKLTKLCLMMRSQFILMHIYNIGITMVYSIFKHVWEEFLVGPVTGWGEMDPGCGVGRYRVSQALPFSMEVRDGQLLLLVVPAQLSGCLFW